MSRPRFSETKEARDQAAVLKQVLWEYPTMLRCGDLQRQLFHERLFPEVRISESVECLVKAGLLRREGDWVLPTDPALYLHSLLEIA